MAEFAKGVPAVTDQASCRHRALALKYLLAIAS
jgi:hypothetical protein